MSSGFISIDCGISEVSSYTDKTTGISYLSDLHFTTSGENKELPESTRAQNIDEQQFWNVRSFPNGTRNCYTLKPEQGKGTTYLIRARFMYGNYDGKEQAPTFDLYVGAGFWDTVTISDAWTIINKEIIHIPSSDHMQVCLVNTSHGIPFISVLELRPLSNDVYKTKNGSLQLYGRFDFSSSSANLEVLRYKGDAYDRLWESLEAKIWSPFIHNDSLTDENSIAKNNYTVPFIIMNTAYTRSRSSSDGYNMNLRWNNLSNTSEYYFYMHFAELQQLRANQTREFNIYINGGSWYGPMVPNYLSTTTIYSPAGWTADSEGQIDIWLNSTGNSNLPPLINAMEMYVLKDLSQQETNTTEVEAITNIKLVYEVEKNWEGDPCAPEAYLWDGLNCSYNANNPSRIVSLNLSSSGLKGEIAQSIANLTMLQYL
ncbi:Malectin-like carbohydrate-binding domain containing protein [Trema orientale]|uniref:Malectin-like carbohydrate-binding domain containing protein n=1 Tax=Trema orientale TaxID=63057 RepID=A0A2P5BD91_TREOI|nr:Malectin-like carbohydrate-binding domain containing protein [Trema orientale]